MKKKKVIVTGFFGANNLGDDLLLQECLRRLPSNYELFIPANNREKGLLRFKKYREFTIIKRPNRSLYNVNIYSGGGTVVSLKFGVKQLYYSLKQLCTQRKIILNGIQITPKDKSSSFWFKLWLKRMSYISVRDNISLEYLRSLGVRNAINCGDLYFGAPTPLSDSKRLCGKNALICLARAWTDEELEMESKHKHYLRLVKAYHEIIHYLVDKGYNIVFIPFYDYKDDNMIQHIISLDPPHSYNYRIVKEGVDYELDEVNYYFQEADIAVCMRFHSLVLSIKNMLPCVAICYDYKSKSLLDECGLPEIGVEYGFRKETFWGYEKDLDITLTKEKIEYVIMNQGYIKERMKLFAENRKKSVDENYKRIFSLV